MEPDPNWPEIAQKRARKVKILSHYKFYLAFENLQVGGSGRSDTALLVELPPLFLVQ